jgi:hypothetical protein
VEQASKTPKEKAKKPAKKHAKKASKAHSPTKAHAQKPLKDSNDAAESDDDTELREAALKDKLSQLETFHQLMEQHYKETLGGNLYHVHGKPFPGEEKSESKSYSQGALVQRPPEYHAPQAHIKKSHHKDGFDWGYAESKIPHNL